MKWFGYLLVSLSSISGIEAQYGWPSSKTYTYTVVGGDELGFFLPIPDFQVDSRELTPNKLASINLYESLIDSKVKFIFLSHPCKESMDVCEFAKKCLSCGNFFDLPNFINEAVIVESGSFLGGKERNVPFILAEVVYRDQRLIEFIFTHCNTGYALIAACDLEDRGAIEKWKEFFFSAIIHLECFEPK